MVGKFLVPIMLSIGLAACRTVPAPVIVVPPSTLITCSSGTEMRRLPTEYWLEVSVLEQVAQDSFAYPFIEWYAPDSAAQATLPLEAYLAQLRLPDILGDLEVESVEGTYVYQMAVDSTGGLAVERILKSHPLTQIIQRALTQHLEGGRLVQASAWHNRHPIIVLRLHERY